MDHALRLNARIAEALVIRPPKNMIVKKKHSALNSLSRWSVWGYTSWGVPGGVASVVEVVDHPLSEMYHPAHGRLDLLGAANGGRTRKPCDVYVGVSSPSWPTDTSALTTVAIDKRSRVEPHHTALLSTCSLCQNRPVAPTHRGQVGNGAACANCIHQLAKPSAHIFKDGIRKSCTNGSYAPVRKSCVSVQPGRDPDTSYPSANHCAKVLFLSVGARRASSDRSTKHGTFTVSLRRTAWTQSVTRGSWRLPLTVATGTKMAMVSAIAAALAAFAAAAAAAAATATVELFCHPKKVQHLNNRLL